ncbi:MAG: guanylate kinase [Xanthobacteraceae bacterium]|nr:MAG: guanylate kinase [Xanthobacteraceae bacterium]
MRGGGSREAVERRGLMFVLSSPSGAGKTTLARKLIAEVPGLRLSVSTTTRPMRPGEVDGRDYHFVDAARFEAMVGDNAFLEWANVFDHRYGTPRAPVEAALAAGHDILFDIDWQGTQQLRDQAPSDVVSVFILPPTVADLEQRLRARAQDSDAVIHRRMTKAGDEMSHWDAYDYIVINRDIAAAFDAVRSILFAERLRRERQVGLSAFVRSLRAQL